MKIIIATFLAFSLGYCYAVVFIVPQDQDNVEQNQSNIKENIIQTEAFQFPEEDEQFEQAPPMVSIYTFGPNNDPGVCPGDLNMRDYGPPDYNYPPGTMEKFRQGGPFPIISTHYLRAVSEKWPDGHYPL